jgi:hypothetical protein
MFKASAVFAAALLLAAAATATTKPPAQPSGITNANNATAAAAASARGGSAWSAGGSGGAGGAGGLGGAGGTVGSVFAGGVDLAGARIGSDIAVERSTPPLYAPQPTAGGFASCPKPGITAGGSGPGGGGILSFTFGTDATCRLGQALDLMARDRANFTAEDRKQVACKQEDIAETPTCKALARKLAESERASAALEDRPAPTARQPMPWQAGG